ncbi:4-hydroxy-tetrahydrodipicolinate reductase [Agromyces mangrovi Wang et al. 2018]|uniref:4-hydroxy-tetrahydrodipicolinate reductase n=1 Tax=Agromyces mangrovi TaxID=1858653 RepID=UPI0025736DCC|nr:dihydrodipicolinate reductase C-terminal domain-containing protein [Agromyces mangrovi]
MTSRVAVVGATGRMGRLALGLIEQAEDLEVHAELDSSSSLDEIAGADVVFDVTRPGVTERVVDHAIDLGIPTVVGTSGWPAERIDHVRGRLASGDEDAPGILFVPNFSLGSVLASRFAAIAAPYFDSIEIIEAHHAGKVDSPSGTAVRTAELIGGAHLGGRPVSAPHSDQRARGQLVAGVPVHSLRMDGVLAKQDVIMGATGETLTLTHTTQSPSSYEAGILLALRAAPEARGVSVGLETLLDLGLPTE